MTLSTCAVCKRDICKGTMNGLWLHSNPFGLLDSHAAVPIAAHSGERPRLMLIRGGLDET